jgi:transposase
MITLRVDPHPGSHTVVALDPNGATLASITVLNTSDGLCQLHPFAVPFASRRWAIEGVGHHFIAVFVGQLLERSEMVYSMPPSLSGQYRSRRGRKKNDVVDAENVGRALLANPQLTLLHNTEQQRELQELTRAQRSAIRREVFGITA